MKVAIDISPLKSGHQFRGIGFYTKNLVEALKKYPAPDFQVDVLEKGQIPQDCDLVHYPYFDFFQPTLSLIKPRETIVTIHDVTPLVFPDQYPPGISGKLKFWRQKISLKNVDAVICDSQNSKKDIFKYLNYPKNKIFVVYLAPGEHFRQMDSTSLLYRNVVKKYRLPKRFVLYVGDANYNKNIRGLVKACGQAKLPLVIVGKQAAERNIDRNHPENRDLVWLQEKAGEKKLIANHQPLVTLLGFVPDEDLVAIYNLATVYCQPSFYEGFGLPVLEAMACGTPVVTSNQSSLPEVAGKAAILVNPYDINDIANGLESMLADKKLREDLIRKGKEQAKKFSWEKVAEETYRVYRKIIREKQG